MFNELLSDIKGAISTVKHGTPTTELTFAKPYCTPARGIIEPVLAKYGVKVYGYKEEVKMIGAQYALKNLRVDANAIESITRMLDPLPTAQVAKVTVSEAAAAWCEYLLLRTGKMYRVGGYVDRRNEQWAARHNGQMPPAWDNGTPWIEASCSNGIEAWQGAKQAIKQAQNARKQQQKGKGRK